MCCERYRIKTCRIWNKKEVKKRTTQENRDPGFFCQTLRLEKKQPRATLKEQVKST